MNHPAALAVAALTGYTALYLLVCVVFPFRACRRCHGTGTRPNPFLGGGYRQCRTCRGTGRRVRLGRRIYEYLRTEHRRGQIPGDPRPRR
jgi:hypothetical protein